MTDDDRGRSGPTVVIGGGRGIGRGVARVLRQRGRTVTVVDGDEVDLAEPAAVRAALAAADGSPSTVVIAHLDAAALTAEPVVSLDEAGWDAAAERPLRSAVVVLQEVHAAVSDGARVVVVLPTVAATGVAGLVPLCTAVEGIRVLLKAVARRWGQRGITVNTVEVDLEAFVLGDAEPTPGQVVPAVPQIGTPALAPGSAVADVAGLVELLDDERGAAVTGALLVADRGTVMLP